ncbi:hypothetical protein BJV82DRAFT_274514 [Fennellomyces sp. T-0311]|nr:hypothetical protein BJV82DRAFT_274514 [Fennellomyces sp. T-0311]
MDSYGILYGFNVPVAALSFVTICASIIQAVKAGQHRWQYTFIFLGGVFCLAKKLLYILLISGAVFQTTTYRQAADSTISYIFFERMFIPFVYAVFFRTCHIAIIVNQPMVGHKRPKKGLGVELFSARFAYTWLVTLIGTNIGFCISFSTDPLLALPGLEYVNIFGIWLFALLALTAGITALYFLPPLTVSLSLTAMIIDFVVVEMMGLFGLLFALWALQRHWPAGDKKPLIINQPSYTYVPTATGHQGGLYSYSPATGAPSQAQYQIPQVVQIPQPQYQQAGQFPIVQVPIDQNDQQYGQYSSYRFT